MNIKISEKAVLYRLQDKNTNYVKEPIGAYIKKERISQGLNQDYVCKDICSVSYYSRIENNLIIPSNEYVKKIFLKLNKPIPSEISMHNNNNEVIDDFLTAIEYRNDKLIEEEFAKLQKLENIKIELYKLVYYLYKYNLEETEKYISILHPQQNYLNNKQLLLYLEQVGGFYILKQEYEKAEKYLLYAIKLQDYLDIKRPTLLYKYAWILGKLNYDLKSIEYAQEAENIFIKNHNIYFSVQCQILIAIKMSNKFPEKAIAIYEKIIKLTNHEDLKNVNKISMFNLACLLKKNNMNDQSEKVLLKIINKYDKELDFIVDVYVEYIDLLLSANKKNDSYIFYKKLYSKNIKTEKSNFYMKYYGVKFKENDLKTIIKDYKNEFIPYSIKTNNLILEIRCRKEYALLLEKNKNYEDCIYEYKQLIKLFDKRQ